MYHRVPGLQRPVPLWLRALNFVGRTISGGNFAGDHQISQTLRWTGVITPTQLTSDVNDYNPTGLANTLVIRQSTDGTTRQITGLQGGVDGRIIIIRAIGGAGLFLAAEHGGSSAANRFTWHGNGSGVYMPPNSAIELIYDGTLSRWTLTTSLPTLTTGIFGQARIAGASEYRSAGSDGNGAVLSPQRVWEAAQIVGLVDAATVAVDFAAGFNFGLIIGGNRALGNPSNTKDGQSGKIYIFQDGTGNRTLSYSANWEFAGGVAPTLSTPAGSTDILYYDVLSSTRIMGVLAKAWA